MSGPAVTSFSRDVTRILLGDACDRVGLPADGAELLRIGENAIYRLASAPVVVRIARHSDHWDDAAKEVQVAGWLERAEVPAAQVWPIEQPLSINGHPVTFWRFIDGRRGGPGDVRDLGALLRRIHTLPRPTTFVLPGERVLGRVRARIERAPVPPEDRAFLLGLLGDLTSAVGALDYVLPTCVTHGDAHVQNLMVNNRDVKLIDFERVAWGQPEWDLAMTATEFVTAQFWTRDQYDTFVDAYGFDVTEWAGFPVLRRAHEVKMTTWLMQNINESSIIRDEYELRLATIRSGRPGEPWRAF
jgi:Ser/Thr protein kinase RdoA (MazF antagonist)